MFCTCGFRAAQYICMCKGTKKTDVNHIWKKYIFIWYSNGYKVWKFYNPATQKVIILKRADFDKQFFSKICNFDANTQFATLSPLPLLSLQDMDVKQMLFMRKKVDASSCWLFGKYTYQLGLLCGKPSISLTTCYSFCFFFFPLLLFYFLLLLDLILSPLSNQVYLLSDTLLIFIMSLVNK